MQSDYHIEDLVYQTGDQVVYRVRNKKGIAHAVNRIKFPYEILSGLEGGKFEEAYQELLAFKHPCIRTIVDGGQDSIDRFPWVATTWWKGTVLSNKIKEAPLTEEELQRIQSHAESLIEKFGEKAAAISFKPQSIIITRSAEGDLVDTFAIDYHAWFRDWSLGLPPGGNRDPGRELEKLMDSLQVRKPLSNSAASQVSSKPELTTHGAPVKASPFVAPPAPSPAITPSTQVVLPSSSSGGGLKTIFVILLLAGLVGGGLWWIKSQPAKADPQAETAPKKDKKQPNKKETPDKTPPKIDSTPDLTPPPLPPRQSEVEPRVDPPRPSEGEILEVEAHNLAALTGSVGKWVYLNCEVDHMDDNKTIHLKESPLKATLKYGAVSLDPGAKIRLVGILKSPTHLEVPDNTNVEPREEMETLPLKDVYGAEDEKQLRTMGGEKVTVAGKIQSFKTSGSGKTYYLLLNDTKPEFAFSIRSHLADSDELNQDYLKSLIGKTVKVTGSIKVEEIGGRLHINFNYKSHLEVSEE